MLYIYDLFIGIAALTKGSALGNDLMMYSGAIYTFIGLYVFVVNCTNDCYRERLYQAMYRLSCCGTVSAVESCISCVCFSDCMNIRVCHMLKTGCVYHIITGIYFSVLFVMHAKGDMTCVFFFFISIGMGIFEFRRLCGICSIDVSFQAHQTNLRSVAVVPFTQPTEPLVDSVVKYQLDCEWCQPNEDCVKCVCSVCLESMNGQQVVSNYSCVHVFHAACWADYTAKSVYNKRCPTCRAGV